MLVVVFFSLLGRIFGSILNKGPTDSSQLIISDHSHSVLNDMQLMLSINNPEYTQKATADSKTDPRCTNSWTRTTTGVGSLQVTSYLHNTNNQASIRHSSWHAVNWRRTILEDKLTLYLSFSFPHRPATLPPPPPVKPATDTDSLCVDRTDRPFLN
jgi:hypothetical protein